MDKELLGAFDRIMAIQQRTIDGYQRQIDSLKNQQSPNIEVKPAVETTPEPKVYSAQQIYELSKKGGDEWAAVLTELKEKY